MYRNGTQVDIHTYRYITKHAHTQHPERDTLIQSHTHTHTCAHTSTHSTQHYFSHLHPHDGALNDAVELPPQTQHKAIL